MFSENLFPYYLEDVYKRQLNAGTGRPGQQNVTDGGYGLLFHELPGTDHGNPARTGI